MKNNWPRKKLIPEDQQPDTLTHGVPHGFVLDLLSSVEYIKIECHLRRLHVSLN